MKIQELIVVTDHEIRKSRGAYGKTEADMKRDVDILKTWLKQQPHLPDDEDEDRLERILLNNKCRIEKAKGKLENNYTFKSIYPDLMQYYDLKSEISRNAKKYMTFIMLPKLTDKLERIIMCKVHKVEPYSSNSLFQMALLLELFMSYDYALSNIYLVDYADITFDILKLFDLAMMQKFNHLVLNCLNGRFSNLCFFNTPSYMDIFVKILKIIMKPKLYEKISVHKSVDTIYKIVPKELLPPEYGGQERSFYKISDDLVKVMEDHESFFKTIAARRSNEKLRTNSIKMNELFGTDGSFKKLNLD